MKNIIKTIILSVVVLGMSSCTEEKILDLKPVNNILSPDAFTTPTLISTYMNGVYNAAAIGQYNAAPTSPNGGRGYVWGAAFVEQGETRGEDVVNMATFYELTYKATYDPTTANNVYYWVDGYRLINRCNLMIEGVTGAVAKGVITQAVADNYIGQCKFLRAITHLELLTYFARPYNFTPGATHPGIPYREVGVNTSEEIASESAKPRNTVAEVYAKVLTDLNAAETLITTGNSTAFSGRVVGRASKWAAIAFKTRLYLQKRDWANVIVEGNKLTGVFALTADPYAPFQNSSSSAATNNSESIFSIQHSATANPGVNASLPSILKNRALVCISPILWRDTQWWLADDKRREDGKFIYTAAGIKYTNKYTDIVNQTDAAPVIRYAEVVLNMAEAQARLSNLPAALTLLNSVRNRSLANPVATPTNPVGQAYTSASFTTNATMVAAILKERRIEFLQEGRRWTDIHRLQYDDLAPVNGIPAKVASGAPPATAAFVLGNSYVITTPVAAVPRDDYKFLWPIPQIELNTNPGLGQNPEW